MTTKAKKAAKKKASPKWMPPPQVQCRVCGRYHPAAEPCWFCNPPAPAHCHCEDSRIESRVVDVEAELAPGPHLETCGGHVHLDHAVFYRLWQLDVESVDELILLPTLNWPDEDEPVIRAAPRQTWRDEPEYRDFLGRNPDLKSASRRGKEAMFAMFGLKEREAEAWEMETVGYTSEYMARVMKLKPGGVESLLDAAHSKIHATMEQKSRQFAKTG